MIICMMSNRVVSRDRSGAYEDVFGVKKEVFAMKESPCYETVENVVKKNEERSSVNDHSINIRKKLMCTLVIILTICILISMCVCLVFAFVEISRLKSEMIRIQQIISPGNETEFNELSLTSDLFKEKIKNIEKELLQHNSSHILELDHLKQSIENTTQQLINTLHYQLSQQIENESQQLNSTFNLQLNQRYLILESNTQQLINSLWSTGEYQSYPAASCATVLLYAPFSPSGHYWVWSSNGSAVHVYCDMTRSCGNITGGWMRVGELDMTNSSTHCPSGLRHHTDSNIRTCTRNSNSGGCSSVTLYTSNIHYSRVCGKIKAYQFGSTNAFGYNPDNIDSYYVDGVSLTHGRPRQHIWTFAAARDETTSSRYSNCPCTNIHIVNSATPPPAFVGNDYFCDTGSTNQWNLTFYSDDPLWDGAGCGPQSTCCSFNNPPWFYKQLPQPTTDDIEMRVCRSKGLDDEDISIEMFDIYIQ